MSHPGATASDRHKVVIVGSGFGGLTAAQKLIGDFAPKLVSLTDETLFGDVWARSEPPSTWRRRSVTTSPPTSSR